MCDADLGVFHKSWTSRQTVDRIPSIALDVSPPYGEERYTRRNKTREKNEKTKNRENKQEKKWPSCADNPMTRAERKLYPGGNTLMALPIHLAFSLSAHCGKQSVK